MIERFPRISITCAWRVAALGAGLMLALLPAHPAFAKPKREPSAQPAPQVAPAKPKIIPGADPGGIAVALIGTGVNYTLPTFANRLARDGEGDIIGLDFVDRDNRPFDAGPELAPAPFGASPLGTTLASVLLTEAPRSRLVPVRLRLGEPRNFGGAAAFVAATPARIALVAFTSPNRVDWEPFEQAAKAAPHVLFVLPAGDSNQNIDQQPLFPASLGLENTVVVTAATADGRILPDANTGVLRVDVAVPADEVAALALNGTPMKVSGSLAAAARVAALAARLLAADPRLTAVGIKDQLRAAAQPTRGEVKVRTRLGWIANPEAWPPVAKP
jgi:subtilisin family serine protease